jgi:hypothetical protein
VTGILLVVLLAASGCLVSPSDDFSAPAIDGRVQINALLDQADVAHQAGDEVTAQQRRDDAAALECQVFGCEVPAGSTTVAMDPTLAGGFFSAPWPSDTRLRADGTLDLTGFPGRATVPIADVVLGRGEAVTHGYGTNSGVFLQATGPLDPATLPLLAEGSVHRRSNAMLLDLDHPAAAPVPVLADVRSTDVTFRPANLITLLPYPGHPLAPNTRYAAALFDGVRDAAGNRLAPAPILTQLDGSAPSGVSPTLWDQLRLDRDDLVAAVRLRTLWHPSELVAFTAFTTQDPTRSARRRSTPCRPAGAGPHARSQPVSDRGTSHTTGRAAPPNCRSSDRS